MNLKRSTILNLIACAAGIAAIGQILFAILLPGGVRYYEDNIFVQAIETTIGVFAIVWLFKSAITVRTVQA